MTIGLEQVRTKKIGEIEKDNGDTKKLERLFIREQQLSGKRTGDKVKTLLCPMCGGKELYYEAGLITGYKYHCKDCDYIGAFVIEKEFKI